MSMIRFYTVGWKLLLLIWMLFILPAVGNTMELTREAIVNIANKTARDLGYHIEDMNIHIDKDNTQWTDYESFLKKNKQIPETLEAISNKLKDKHYWAVYYSPNDPELLGGDLWVFVDGKNGEVIIYLRGA